MCYTRSEVELVPFHWFPILSWSCQVPINFSRFACSNPLMPSCNPMLPTDSVPCPAIGTFTTLLVLPSKPLRIPSAYWVHLNQPACAQLLWISSQRKDLPCPVCTQTCTQGGAHTKARTQTSQQMKRESVQGTPIIPHPKAYDV